MEIEAKWTARERELMGRLTQFSKPEAWDTGERFSSSGTGGTCDSQESVTTLYCHSTKPLILRLSSIFDTLSFSASSPDS